MPQLVGVELCEPAVEDARINAKLNGIDNAVFLCDRAENVMQDVLARADEAGAPPSADAPAVDGDVAAPEGDTVASNGDAAGAEGADNDAFRVVAVVDPPRGGLMKPVLRYVDGWVPREEVVGWWHVLRSSRVKGRVIACTTRLAGRCAPTVT